MIEPQAATIIFRLSYLLENYWLVLLQILAIVVDEDGLDGLVVLQYTSQNIVDIKGQSNEIFDLQYFSSFEPAWASAQLARPQVLIKT